MTKVAVTEAAADIVTSQVPVPGQLGTDQPVKIDPTLGDAVSRTVAPSAKGALQVAPQVIPTGVDVTVPVPLPSRATESVIASWKVAVTSHGVAPVQPGLNV